jgi:hypothetical protein
MTLYAKIALRPINISIMSHLHYMLKPAQVCHLLPNSGVAIVTS